jgi:hypothetical protein
MDILQVMPLLLTVMLEGMKIQKVIMMEAKEMLEILWCWVPDTDVTTNITFI